MNKYPQETQTTYSIVNWLLEWHIEQTISEEMVQRVLAPVLARIKAGEFDEQLKTARRKAAIEQLIAVARRGHMVIIDNGGAS